MRNVGRIGILVLACSLITGCFSIETVVHVNKDGSGTVTEKMLMGRMFVEQMKAMASQMGSMGGDAAGGGFALLDEEKLRARAARMGEGVSLVKAEPVSNAKGEGYKALFAFTDVRKLRLNQNPGDVMPSSPGEEAPPAEEFIVFAFDAGSTSILKITMPEESDDEGAGESMTDDESFGGMDEGEVGNPDDEAMAEQMKMMFKDMRISMAVEVEGEIVDTNASHREGSRITLMELDFGKLLENPEKFEALQSAEGQNLQEVKKLMEDLPGIKVELNPELKVSFR